MTQTIHRATGHKTRFNQEITLVRGNDAYYSFPHSALASEIAKATFTARKASGGLGTGTVVVQIDSDTHAAQWDLDTDGLGELDFLDTNTKGLTSANDELSLEYDIEFYLNDATYFTVEIGIVSIKADDTHDDDTAAYLAWETRSDYSTQLSQLTAGLDITYLSAAASASDTDIDVDDASIFSVADDIRILLTAGGYDEKAIATITDNNIDFTASGGLSGAAAIDSVVLKVS